MAMRDQIHAAILEGGATKESLLALTGTTEKGLASQFTYLRMMGKCPMKQDDGTWKIVSAEEWDAHRASGGGGGTGKILTPKERVERAEKRSKRASTAYDNAVKKQEENPEDELTRLKFVKAEAELQIAEIELGKAEQALADAPPEPETEGEDVVITEEDIGELEVTEDEPSEEDLQ